MSKFKIGDRVVIVRSPIDEMVGLVAVVIDEKESTDRSLWVKYGLLPVGHRLLELNHKSLWLPGSNVCYPPSHLQLLPDDSSEKADWESLPTWARKAFGREVVG